MPEQTSFNYGTGFRSLTAETAEPVRLSVTGRLPSWLEGTLLRTGPAKFEVGARSYNHWFDGLAMLHRFAVAGGGVTYANRFLESKAFSSAQATGKICYSEFATDPCRTLFGRVAAMFDPKLTDNCNVNISGYAREMVAFTETSMPVRFSPDTLTTLGVFAYGEALPGQISTAHPHYDAKRACHYNYIADLGMKSLYRICRIGDDGAEWQLAEIPGARPAYMHSFGMSEDHLILTEFPLVVNPLDLRLSGKPFIENYRWEPERGIVFHVIAKDTGAIVRTAKTDAAFVFHHVNAFAEAGGLAVDVVAYADASIIDQLYLARLRANTPIDATGRLTRFHVPLAGDAPITRKILAEMPLDLPRINYERCAGKPYRYLWGTGIEVQGDFVDSIVKVDTQSGTAAAWYRAGLYPGEPVFVPSPTGKGEDDGVLLSIVLDTAAERSFLLVLDAGSLAELARADAPHAIPFHFHGAFFPKRGLT
jgi:carotenoid cleavage dioxygenase-like enzyme